MTHVARCTTSITHGGRISWSSTAYWREIGVQELIKKAMWKLWAATSVVTRACIFPAITCRDFRIRRHLVTKGTFLSQCELLMRFAIQGMTFYLGRQRWWEVSFPFTPLTKITKENVPSWLFRRNALCYHFLVFNTNQSLQARGEKLQLAQGLQRQASLLPSHLHK